MFVATRIVAIALLFNLILGAEIWPKSSEYTDVSQSDNYQDFNNASNVNRSAKLVGRTVITNSTTYTYSAFINVYNSDHEVIERCSGAVLSQSYVITAASCIIDGTSWEVIVGQPDLATEGATPAPSKSFAISKIHPNFIRNTHENDIALLQVSPPFDLDGGNIGVLLLPTRRNFTTNREFDGKTFRVVGYGLTTAEKRTSFDAVRNYVDMKGMEPNSCVSAMRKLQYRMAAQQACLDSNGGKAGVCQGDVGAPLVTIGNDVRLAGVVSTHLKCTDLTLFTRIGPMMNWIRQVVKQETTSG